MLIQNKIVANIDKLNNAVFINCTLFDCIIGDECLFKNCDLINVNIGTGCTFVKSYLYNVNVKCCGSFRKCELAGGVYAGENSVFRTCKFFNNNTFINSRFYYCFKIHDNIFY